MTIKVSVVVPVYNPGDFIEPCVESLLAQTLASTELELIFVDDGSTDDSLGRLRGLETAHQHVRVISIPNSGWPGKPRNVGTDAATGTYVMYVDQDDRLDPESLERMYALGSANDADIVLGKVTSDFRGVHQYLYREQRPRCTVYDARLINSQTPHKMLRRQFLIDNGIRYPEGRRRLEDQLFITKAYFAARSCSIVADYVCYRYLERPDGGNAGDRQIDAPAYFENLRDVLDVIDAHVEPGPVRDHFYRRFLRVEMLGKLSGQKVIKTDLGQGELTLAPIRELAEERFPLSVDLGLPATARLRAQLMRHGTFADVKELTEHTRRVYPDARAAVRRASDGTVRLRVRGEVVEGTSALRLDADTAGVWLLPVTVTGTQVASDLRRIEDPTDMVADVVVIHRKDGDEWFVDHPLTMSLETQAETASLRVAGDIALDIATAAGGRPLSSGRHQLSLRMDALGLHRLKPLRADLEAAGGDGALAVISHRPRTLLEVARSGRLSLNVGVSAKAVRHCIAPVAATWEQGRLTVELGAAWLATAELTAELRSPRGRATPVLLRCDDERGSTWRSSVDGMDPGRYDVWLLLPRAGAVQIPGTVAVPYTPANLARTLTRRARGALRRVRNAVRRAT